MGRREGPAKRELVVHTINAVNGKENINRMWRQPQGRMQIQSKMHLKVARCALCARVCA